MAPNAIPTIIIQARMTSTRLPGKVLADLNGKPALAFMLDRVSRAADISGIVIATTTNAEDDPVAALCKDMQVPVFRGDEMDVLGRYAGAAREFDASAIIRLTADCPMMDPALIDQAVSGFQNGDFDFFTNSLDRTYPDGLDIEIFTRDTLEITDREADLPFQREHVTPYMRTGFYEDVPTGDFSVGQMKGPADFSHLRWTVDYPEDLRRVRAYVRQLPDGFGWLDAVALATRVPELLGDTPDKALDRPVLRKASQDDDRLLFDWVNHPDSLNGKLHTETEIDWDTHVGWLRKQLNDPDTAIWIAEVAEKPVGQVRVEKRQSGLEVDVFLAQEARGAGVACQMIEVAASECAGLWPEVPMIARVRPGNMPSRRLFARAGFGLARVMPDHLILTREQPAARPANG